MECQEFTVPGKSLFSTVWKKTTGLFLAFKQALNPLKLLFILRKRLEINYISRLLYLFPVF